MEVHLEGATSNACLTLTIDSVEDLGANALAGDNDVQARVLSGDVDGSGNTDIIDLSLVKSSLFVATTDATKTLDVFADGILDIIDLSRTKANLFVQLTSCP